MREFIDFYGDLGQKCNGIEDKSEAHQKALIHKGVCVWIMNSRGEIWLQIRNGYVVFPIYAGYFFLVAYPNGKTSLEVVRRELMKKLASV